jgi:uncharacterized phiE125 gp8 family phage protein
VIEVTSIESFSESGVATEFDPAGYFVDITRAPARVSLRNAFVWPADVRAENSIVVTYDAGYGDDPALVPVEFIQAICLLVGHWHSRREAAIEDTVREIEFGVKALIDPYRVTA